jgi:phosphatidylinositol kinase/protein kinase (PI-3  family)
MSHLKEYKYLFGFKTILPQKRFISLTPSLSSQCSKIIFSQLLTDLGKHHPQALVYPLTVACKSSNPAQRGAANKILNKIREHSQTLVNQVKHPLRYLVYRLG